MKHKKEEVYAKRFDKSKSQREAIVKATLEESTNCPTDTTEKVPKKRIFFIKK